MTNVGVREYTVETGERRARMMRNLLGLRIVVTAGGAALGVGFAAVAGYDATMVAGTALGGVALVLGILQATYAVPLQSMLRLGWVTAIDILRQAATVVFILVLIAVGAGLLPLLGVTIPVALVVLAATIPLVRGACRRCRPTTARSGGGCCASRSRSPPRRASASSTPT